MVTEEWIANLQASGLGPSGERQARQVLNAILTLDADEVERLADVGGHLYFGPTKNHRSRIVPIPGFLRDLFAEHVDRHVPNDPEALVFTTPNGTPLRNSNFRQQIWCQAVAAAELPQGLRIHDLRHTCASLLAAADANPRAAQLNLGHSSITATMDRYTHLFPSDVDALIRRLDDVRARNLAAPPRPKDQSRGIELGGSWQKPRPQHGSQQHARRNSNPQPPDP